MSRGKAIALGVFTAWPFLYMAFSFGAIFWLFISDFSGGPHPNGLPTIFMVIFPLHFLTMLIIFALLVIYIVHVFKTNRIPEDKKALWAVVLFLGSMIAMPIYWYLYIWSPPKPAQIKDGISHETAANLRESQLG